MIRNARYAAAYVAILAMMLRALVPVGWMPSGIPGHTFTICTVDGFQRITPSHRTGDHDPAPAHSNSVCPFAASAHFAPPVAAPVLSALPTTFTTARFAASLSLPAGTARDWNRAPRAPPTNS
jgi:hypothetical protein